MAIDILCFTLGNLSEQSSPHFIFLRCQTMKSFLFLLTMTSLMIFAEDTVNLQFKGPDVYKTQWGIDRPTFIDINDDGKMDFIIADVVKGKLELHISVTSEEQKKDVVKSEDINNLSYDKKYRIEYFLTENQIVGVWAGKLFDKKKTSIIYATGTNELFILEKNENGVWAKEISFEIKPVTNQGFQNIFVADFNGDKLNDILLVGVLGFQLHFQDKKGTFSTNALHLIEDPFKNKIFQVFTHDINGDKKLDISYLTSGDIFLKYRLQLEDGSLSAEHTLEGDKIMSGTINPLESKAEKNLYLSSIQAKSNAISISKINFESSENKTQKIFGTPEQLLLPDSKKPYTILLEDINGDGIKDILATTPTSAEVLVYLLDKAGSHKNMRKFSCYMSINDMQVFDWDKDGKNEVYILSKEENTFGKTNWKNDNLPFPERIKTIDTPVSFIFASLTTDAPAHLVMMETVEKKELDEKGQEKAGSSKKFSVLRIYDKLNEKFIKEHIFEKALSDTQLKAFDINNDGKTDFLVFEKYSKPQVLLQKDDGTFEVLNQNNSKLGLLLDSEIKPWQIGVIAKDKSLMTSLSRKSFARLIQYKDGAIETVEQFNSEESVASIVSVLQEDLDKDKTLETIFYDEKNNLVDVYTNTATGFMRKEKINIGPFKFTNMTIQDINSDKKNDLILFGENKILILKNNHPISDLTPLSTYFPEENVRKQYSTLEVGELLPGRFQELAIVDSINHTIELFYLTKAGKLTPMLTFKIFEERQFQQGEQGLQPKHVVIKDLNGDGLNDLFLVVHDKILIYTQTGANNEKSK